MIAATSADTFVTFFIEDSYGVRGSDHVVFGNKALNLSLPVILFDFIVMKILLYSP
jgi:hypothetical protein